ncbi:hypothetical protein VTK73DRAFT_8319 [Phialemonium thermophilum]|uniref:Nucleolar 27S pre-rRNA processing Urb2/Npa2 C-terminal domain-containing protein n=1 Tax=Phialemonium thermophilum TaxID=223376 RepID=A0ABR3Y7M5_9PEZI
MAENNNVGEFALIRTARTLDQEDVETIPDKLDQILKILDVYSGGNFHAAEEMIVRWLLKTMNGPSADSERLRRYPLAWRTLAALFSSVPLSSLAKSLADRRFVNVLQAALKDLSDPATPGSGPVEELSDIDMPDADSNDTKPRPSKRTKRDPDTFDLQKQKSLHGILRSTDALFAALRSLLVRLDSMSNETYQNDPMAAEHIKSLFSTYSHDIRDIIAPLLRTCELSLNLAGHDTDGGQDTWIATVSSIWDLHVKNEGDAREVATHLTRPVLSILDRLGSIRARSPEESKDTWTRWEQDLRRFLTRSLVLPARAVFINQGNAEALQVAVQMASATKASLLPLLFDVILSLPPFVGAQAVQRANEEWIQTAFNAVESSIRASKALDRDKSLLSILDLAVQHRIELSLDSLRLVSAEYALSPERTNWALLLRLCQINSDVFVAEDQREHLRKILGRTTGTVPLESDQSEPASLFIIALSAGFARSRDVAGFIIEWFLHLALCKPHLHATPSPYRLWYNEELGRTTAQAVQRSMSTRQVLHLLDWLDLHRGEAEDAATILILGEVAKEVRDDELFDAIGIRVFNMVFERSRRQLRTASIPTGILAARWIVVEKVLAWATLEEAQSVWTMVFDDLKQVLDQSPVASQATFQAFKCSVAAWLANYGGGNHEAEAAAVSCKFLDRIGSEAFSSSRPTTVSGLTYVNYILVDCPRMLSLVVEQTGRLPNIVLSFLFPAPDCPHPMTEEEGYQSVDKMDLISKILENQSNISNRKLIGSLLDFVVGLMESEKGRWSNPAIQYGVNILLAVPIEAVTREQRERIIKVLVSKRPKRQARADTDMAALGRTLSLMVMLMRSPTFYTGMKFDHLDSLVTYLGEVAEINGQHYVIVMTEFLPLIRELVSLTTRQMAQNVGKREEEYIVQAVSLVPTWFSGRQNTNYATRSLRLVLLACLISAMHHQPALKGNPRLNIDTLRASLVTEIGAQVDHFCTSWESRAGKQSTLELILPLLVALDCGSILNRANILAAIAPFRPRLLAATKEIALDGCSQYWDLLAVMKVLFVPAEGRPGTSGVTGTADKTDESWKEAWSSLETAGSFDRTSILSYVDTVVDGADDGAKLGYLHEWLKLADTSSTRIPSLVAAYRIVQRIEGSRIASASNEGKFDLASAHTLLCQKLRASESRAEFAMIAQIIQAVLEKPGCITQWDVELTLSTVSVLCGEAVTHPVVSTSPQAYKWLCRLVQSIVRRHRLRLEGHLHLLVTTLQDLLRTLLLHPYDDTTARTLPAGCLARDPSRFPHWESHARLFTRLITLVCEPSVASVSRQPQGQRNHLHLGASAGGGLTGPLDSATDAAKRSAGLHMYLVLMLYVQLQLEQVVPHAVREAMEPAVFSILDITTGEVRRIMTDSMDANGRAILRELYKQYLKFGKWTGV